MRCATVRACMFVYVYMLLHLRVSDVLACVCVCVSADGRSRVFVRSAGTEWRRRRRSLRSNKTDIDFTAAAAGDLTTTLSRRHASFLVSSALCGRFEGGFARCVSVFVG